jgi:hypothetical protein
MNELVATVAGRHEKDTYSGEVEDSQGCADRWRIVRSSADWRFFCC